MNLLNIGIELVGFVKKQVHVSDRHVASFLIVIQKILTSKKVRVFKVLKVFAILNILIRWGGGGGRKYCSQFHCSFPLFRFNFFLYLPKKVVVVVVGGGWQLHTNSIFYICKFQKNVFCDKKCAFPPMLRAGVNCFHKSWNMHDQAKILPF